MTTGFHVSLNGRFIEVERNTRRKELYRINQGYNFLGGSFNNRDNVRAQIQFKEKVNPSILKGNFSSRAEPSIFTSIAPVLLDLLKVAVEFFQQ